MLSADKIKNDFPIFKKQPELVYLDSTATSLKPQSVISKLVEYYTDYSANIFRGVYDMSEKATAEYEETRTVVKDFIHAPSEKEIIFTRNSTESINVFINGVSDTLHKGDEIVTTISEHHSNFVPWQQLAKKKGLVFRCIDIDDGGYIEKDLSKYITKKTKILAITYASNVLGTVNSIKEIIREAKKINSSLLVLVDGAQAAPHIKIDVQDLDCDALAFSGHKMLGPTGIGVLWTKKCLLETFPPYQYGGEMISSVSVAETQFADLPHRFEAGTPDIGGVIALKEAIYYLQKIRPEKIHKHEVELAQYCYDLLKKEFGKEIRLIGPGKRESGIVAFTIKDIHAHDIAQVLNEDNIAVRAGHHCAMQLHARLGIDASVRASFYLYNSKNDVKKLISSLHHVVHLFT